MEGILAFAERILPRASDLWTQASLDERQRLQQLFFPDGIAFEEMRFVRTGVNSPAFNYLTTIELSKASLVALNSRVGTGFANGSGALTRSDAWHEHGPFRF